MNEYLELRIPINENTTKKIVALAALTGQSLGEIKEAISESLIDQDQFDQYVSKRLRSALSDIDGFEQEENVPAEVTQSVISKTKKKTKSFADTEQSSMGSIVDDIGGHSLSHDEDEGAPSLDEQYEQEEKNLRAAPAAKPAPKPAILPQAPVDAFAIPDFDVPSVGANAEAFLDSALDMSPPQRQQTVSRYGKAAKSFNPQQRKAKVAEYTGDESEDLF
jgi:hypothetical protein